MVNLPIFKQNFHSRTNIATLYDVIRDDTKTKFGININDAFQQSVLPDVMKFVWDSFGQQIFAQPGMSFQEKLLMINKEVCRESIEYIGAKLPQQQPPQQPQQPQHITPQQPPPRPRPSGPSGPATYEQQLADRNRMYQPAQPQETPQLPSEQDADKPITDDEMDRRMQDLMNQRQYDREAQIDKPDDDAEIIPEVLEQKEQQKPQPKQDFRDIAKKLSQQYLTDRTISAPSVLPQPHHITPPQTPTPTPQPPQEIPNMILRVAYDTQHDQQLFTRTPSGHITPIITPKQQSTILSRVASNMKIDHVIIREFRATNTGWNIHCRNNVVTLKESPSSQPITIIIEPGTYETKESFITAANTAIREQYGEMICIVDIPDGADDAVISLSSDIETFASELLSDITVSGFAKYFETDEHIKTQCISLMGDKIRIPLRHESYAGSYCTSSFEICPFVWHEDDGTIRMIWNGPWTFEKGMDIRMFHADGTLCTECPNHIRIVFDIHWRMV